METVADIDALNMNTMLTNLNSLDVTWIYRRTHVCVLYRSPHLLLEAVIHFIKERVIEPERRSQLSYLRSTVVGG